MSLCSVMGTQHNDTQHNDIQQNATKHKDIIYDTQHNKTLTLY